MKPRERPSILDARIVPRGREKRRDGGEQEEAWEQRGSGEVRKKEKRLGEKKWERRERRWHPQPSSHPFSAAFILVLFIFILFLPLVNREGKGAGRARGQERREAKGEEEGRGRRREEGKKRSENGGRTLTKRGKASWMMMECVRML